MKLETRLTGQLYEAPLVLSNVITNTWMKHTWIATRQVNTQLMIGIPDFQLNQQGDKELLVCVFLQHGSQQP